MILNCQSNPISPIIQETTLKLSNSKSVAAFEETYLFEFALHGRFFAVSQIAERYSVLSKIHADELHDAFSSDDITAIAANHIDDSLREILLLTSRFQITAFPRLQNTCEF